jgi:hypothetical protein
MRDNSLNVAGHLSPVQDRRQSISNKVKQQGGYRVTLAHPPLVAKVRANFSIDRDSRLPPRN